VSGPAVSGPAVSGPAVSGPAVSGPADSGPATTRPADSGPATIGPADSALDTAAVDRAFALVAELVSPGTTMSRSGPDIRCAPADASPTALMRLGADVHRLRAALTAEGLASSVTYGDTALVTVSAA
jgi:coenzyme F420-0:L-glutamate ligase/coenzyme F420-1:gamma-L-glutamate ligase